MQTEDSIIRLSNDDIIELVLESRNDLIRKLLIDSSLREFLKDNYKLDNVSAVKIEFIKRALRELLTTPVDLAHYSALILEIRKSGTLIISRGSKNFFFNDIGREIKNYL